MEKTFTPHHIIAANNFGHIALSWYKSMKDISNFVLKTLSAFSYERMKG